MNRTKRLLVLAPRLPYPVVGGDRLRIHRVCRELAKTFELTLLALCEGREDLERTIPPDGVFSRVERVHLPRWRSWLNCLLALASKTPLQVAYYRSARFRAMVDELAPQHDGVFAHLVRVGDYLRSVERPKFLELTDAISLNYERVRNLGAKSRRLRSLVYALEARRILDYERSVVGAFDLAILVSEVDKDFLFADRASPPSNVLVCGNGVDSAEMPFRFEPAGRDVIFIGNMSSVQNLDAAFHFAADILPRIRSRAPDVRFRAVGRIGARDAARLGSLEGVDVTGEVESIPEAVRGGGVGVCPLRLGAGVQNKVLEYMALGLPTVTTTLGLEGLGARPGVELVAADEAEELAGAVCRLLADRAEAEAMAHAARRYVAGRHSWSDQLAPLVEAIGERLDGADAQRRTG